MKSTVIEINRYNEHISEILDETQKLSAQVGLEVKHALALRLLAEELIGMLKELSDCYEGAFWVEQEGLRFELVVRIRLVQEMDKKTKKGFIDVASNKKNAAAKGFSGKIRDAIENMMYPDDAAYSTNAFEYGAMLSAGWSLKENKNENPDDEDKWDEFEKSIIASMADDVTVSIKSNEVEIIITKNFA